MKLHLCWIPALILMLFFAGCRVEDGSLTSPDLGLATTDVAGVILKEDGTPIAGATVNSHGKSATSNAFGAFYIKDVVAPSRRTVVTFAKDGYFTTGKVSETSPGGLTTVRVVMQQQTNTGTFTASLGGTVQLPGGSQVSFNPNSIVSANGQAYSGIVRVAMRHLDPAGTRFADLFPGDLQARRTDGSDATLYSLGVLRVVLTDANGQALQLANGAKARIEVPISPSQSAIAPAQIPLWFYDIQEGIWKEEGSANKVGTFYIGEVSHFTDWNCDIPERTATVRGQLLCSGEPMPGVWVRVGQRIVYTDTLGNFIARVPAGIELDAEVNAGENMGLTAPRVTISPLNSQEIRVIELQIANCPGYVTATIKSCEGEAASGILCISNGTITRAFFTSNSPIKALALQGQLLTVKAFTLDAVYSDIRIAGPMVPGETFDVGDMRVCHDPGGEVSNYLAPPGASELHISCDGSLMALLVETLNPDESDSAWVINTLDGSTVSSIAIPGTSQSYPTQRSLHFSNDNRRLLVGGAEVSFVFDVQTGELIRSFSGVSNPIMSADGTLLASSLANQKTIRIFGMNSVRVVEIDAPFNHPNYKWKNEILGFSPDHLSLYFSQTTIDVMGTYRSKLFSVPVSGGEPLLLGQVNGNESFIHGSKNSDVFAFAGTGAARWRCLRFFSVSSGQFTEYRETDGVIRPHDPFAMANTKNQILRCNVKNIPGLYDYSNGSVVRVLGDPLEFGTALSWDADCGSQFYGALRLGHDKRKYVRLWRR